MATLESFPIATYAGRRAKRARLALQPQVSSNEAAEVAEAEAPTTPRATAGIDTGADEVKAPRQLRRDESELWTPPPPPRKKTMELSPQSVQKVSAGLAQEQIGAAFRLTRKLGKGHFAEVWLGVSRETGAQHAVKVVDKAVSVQFRKKKRSALPLASEQQLLASLEHPNIVKMFDWIETDGQICLVLEYVPGPTLQRYLEDGRLQELQARRVFQQLCSAVAYLHEQRVVHRDLKPPNVLLTEPDLHHAVVKLADFGISRWSQTSMNCNTFCGTLDYTAPEVIKTVAFLSTTPLTQKPVGYGSKADMWSLGVLLYVMLSGAFPFDDDDDFALPLPRRIIEGTWTFQQHDYAWKHVSVGAKDVVQALMKVDPESRLDAQMTLHTSWLLKD